MESEMKATLDDMRRSSRRVERRMEALEKEMKAAVRYVNKNTEGNLKNLERELQALLWLKAGDEQGKGDGN
jgi:hypothetical protein